MFVSGIYVQIPCLIKVIMMMIIIEGIVLGCCVSVDWIAIDELVQRDHSAQIHLKHNSSPKVTLQLLYTIFLLYDMLFILYMKIQEGTNITNCTYEV
jgi:hypothetical protein